MSSAKKVVIFDFDGTVVASMDSFAEIAGEVIPLYYGASQEEAKRLYFETSGIPFFQQLEQLFPGNKNNDAAAREFEDKKKLDYLSKKTFGDVKGAVESLSEMGIKTVVSSNNFQDLVDMLAANLDVKFDMVLGFRPGFAKGNDHFSYIKKTFNVKKDEMIFVGDSIKDGERADNFGIDFIARTGIFSEKDFTSKFPRAKVVPDFRELKKFV
jgi:phosphoglycolate phosphatase-like HAD superfamily hydrolase